jgi:hypothetical protein
VGPMEDWLCVAVMNAQPGGQVYLRKQEDSIVSWWWLARATHSSAFPCEIPMIHGKSCWSQHGVRLNWVFLKPLGGSDVWSWLKITHSLIPSMVYPPIISLDVY